jgi:predicted Rossmann-fold nucleotide-binding protein
MINKNIHDHLNEIMKEFRVGFEELKKHPKSVTILGSTHSTPASSHYKTALELGDRIVKELGYAVITGGGPGIMAAANLGAKKQTASRSDSPSNSPTPS